MSTSKLRKLFMDSLVFLAAGFFLTNGHGMVCAQQVSSATTQFSPPARFEALSLEECPETRQFLIESDNSNNYYRVLRTVRADLRWLRAGAILRGSSDSTSVTGLILPVSDGPVAVYIQSAVEVILDIFYPTNFFTILADLLRLMCDGIERDESIPSSRLKRVNTQFLKLKLGVLKKRRRITNLESNSTGIFYKRINKGAPYLVLQIVSLAINVFLRLAKLLGSIPLAPIRAVSSSVRITLISPKKIVNFINDRLNGVCDSKKGKLRVVLIVLNILSFLRFLLNVAGSLIGFIVPRTDVPRADEEYRNLFTDDTPGCPILLYDVPGARDSEFTQAEFYKNQLTIVDSLLDEHPDSGRQLEQDEFSTAMDEVEESAWFFVRFSEAIESVEDAINDAMRQAVPNFDEVARALTIHLPNTLETVTNKLGRFTDAIAPVIDIFEAISNVIPEPPFPFGEVVDLFQSLICEAVNLFGSLFGVDDLCGEIEQLIGDLILRAIDDLALPDIDFFDDLFDFSGLDNILSALQVDLEGILDLQFFLPPLYSEFADFFDPEEVFDNLEGLLRRLSITPVDVLNQFIEPPSSLGDGVVETESALAIDSTSLAFTCPLGTTPVTVRADFITDNCRDRLVGQLRFPCPDGESACNVDVAPLLFCGFPEPDDFVNNYLGLPVTRFSVSYLCFLDVADFKFTPTLIEGNSRLTLNRRSPLASAGFDEDLSGEDYSDALLGFSDSFQRPGYLVSDVVSTPMDCSIGGVDRDIYLASINRHIDPCLNGDSFPYATQTNRPPTDLCGYKILFDEGLLRGCSNHDKQSFVGQQRLGDRARVDNAASISAPRVCWEDPSNCQFLNSENRCVPRDPWELSFEDIASNLEVCEYRYSPRRKCGETQPEILGCPFSDYLGLVYNPDQYGGNYGNDQASVRSYSFNLACEETEGLPYAPGTTPLWSSFSCYDKVWSDGIFYGCDKRDTLESQLPMGGYVFPSADRASSRNAYADWLRRFNELEEKCFGDGPGSIADCIRNPSKRCDLADIGCVPPTFEWACVQNPTSTETSRTFIFAEVQESKTISCGTQSVEVDGSVIDVVMELQIESALELMGLVGSSDITDSVVSFCELGPGVSACEFTQGAVFPTGDRVFEIDSTCKCPKGFLRDPGVDGKCSPCPAGFARPDEIDICEICPSGTVSEPGSASCTNCTAGFFQGEPGERFCAPCSAGTYAPEDRAVECQVCEAGSFQPRASETFCEVVSAGFYQPNKGTGTEIRCPPGTYSSESAVECELCPPGTFSASGSPDSCDPCAEGSYSYIFGSTSCSLCPRGFYVDSPNATGCDICPPGLTTRERGAKSSDECQPPQDLALLQSILDDGTSEAFNPSETEPLPDNGRVERSVREVSVGCRALLSKYIDGANTTELLLEVGNGFCNRGPWNTAACAWDGGDCCPQTCEASQFQEEADLGLDFDEEAALTSRACFYRNMECRDPTALQGGIVSSRCQATRESDDRKLSSLFVSSTNQSNLSLRRKDFISKWSQQQVRNIDRGLQADPRLKDGVCHPDLNNEENGFDHGDCCPSTCIFNPAFDQESCDPKAFLNLPVGRGCESGFGCCDPLVEAETFEVSDVAPPIIQVVPDFVLECGAPVEERFLDGPSPFSVTVTDNDPCFDGNAAVAFERNIVESSSTADLEKIEFLYTAADMAGNTGTTTVTAYVQDTLPPVFECPEPITVFVAPGQRQIQLPAMSASDQCEGDIPVTYSTTAQDGISISSDNIMTGWEGKGTPLELNAAATDGSGNADIGGCMVLVSLVTEMPSSEPSNEPSTTPTQSLVPTSNPSEVPSLFPTLNPSLVPTLAPSGFPSLLPTSSPSLLPTSNPSQIPSLLPTLNPSNVPSLTPSVVPSAAPTEIVQVNLKVHPARTNPDWMRRDSRIRITMLSDAAFDATQVDVGTVRAGKTGEEAVALGGSKSATKDENRDGRRDMRTFFRTQELGFSNADLDRTENLMVGIVVTGRFAAGRKFEGVVHVEIAGGKKMIRQ